MAATNAEEAMYQIRNSVIQYEQQQVFEGNRKDILALVAIHGVESLGIRVYSFRIQLKMGSVRTVGMHCRCCNIIDR